MRVRRVVTVICLTMLAGCSPRTTTASEGSRSRRDALPVQEQAILDALNRLRTDPESFSSLIDARRPYYKGKLLQLPGRTPLQTREGLKALDEAVNALDDATPAPALRLAPGLRSAARDHGKDLGARGEVSHDGRDGSTPRDRMSRYASLQGETGEVISFGVSEPEEVVIELVIDDGVPSRGHRKILLNPEFRYAGAACGPHTYYKTVCVIDLAHSVGPKASR